MWGEIYGIFITVKTSSFVSFTEYINKMEQAQVNQSTYEIEKQRQHDEYKRKSQVGS